MKTKTKCPYCDGGYTEEGKIKHTCNVCNGSGFVKKDLRYVFTAKGLANYVDCWLGSSKGLNEIPALPMPIDFTEFASYRPKVEDKTAEELEKLIGKSRKRTDEPPDEDGIYLTISQYKDVKIEKACGLLVSFCYFHDGKFWEKHNILESFPDYWIDIKKLLAGYIVSTSNDKVREALKALKQIFIYEPSDLVNFDVNDFHKAFDSLKAIHRKAIEQSESALASPDKGEDNWISVEKELPTPEVFVDAMDTYAQQSVLSVLTSLKGEISKLRFVTEHPDTRQAYSNIEDLINAKIKECK